MYACMCVLYDKIYHLLAFCRGFATLAWVFGSLGFLASISFDYMFVCTTFRIIRSLFIIRIVFGLLQTSSLI